MCVRAHRKIIERAEGLSQKATERAEIESCRQAAEMSRLKIENIDEEIQAAKESYAYICDNLADPLMKVWKKKVERYNPNAE